MEGQAANQVISLIPIILIFIVFYFLLIRPQQKKQRQHEEMLKGLSKNDEVVTAGGVHGTIINVKDASVILRVDENVKLEVEKQSIARVDRKKKEAKEE